MAREGMAPQTKTAARNQIGRVPGGGEEDRRRRLHYNPTSLHRQLRRAICAELQLSPARRIKGHIVKIEAGHLLLRRIGPGGKHVPTGVGRCIHPRHDPWRGVCVQDDLIAQLLKPRQ